jgi:hypothetical protein
MTRRWFYMWKHNATWCVCVFGQSGSHADGQVSFNYLQDRPRTIFGKIYQGPGLARYCKIELDSILLWLATLWFWSNLLYLAKAFLSILPNKYLDKSLGHASTWIILQELGRSGKMLFPVKTNFLHDLVSTCILFRRRKKTCKRLIFA